MSTFQIILNGVLALMVLAGIAMMSRVRTAVVGNLLSALALLIGVVMTINGLCIGALPMVCIALLVGALIGGVMARRVQMIQMPQTVALFNGLGGGASALVGCLTALGIGLPADVAHPLFVNITALLAVAIGMITLVGSLVAAGKLHRLLPQKPLVWPAHGSLTLLWLILTVVGMIFYNWTILQLDNCIFLCLTVVASSLFGLYFSIRVGGADMPITISLLNSLSGVAGAIAGMAISDVFLVSVGGIVGASGLLLTQIMCRAMNRSLWSILLGTTRKPVDSHSSSTACDEHLIQRIMDLEKKIQELEALVRNLEERVSVLNEQVAQVEQKPAEETLTAASVLAKASDVIIVPGYGMALAQAQHQVRQLADCLESRGARVRYAIHPVAGRMPGHMNVLLAEADVDYEKLYEMEAINDQFASCDAVVVIGANDVLNPAAREAEGTPIYGMPVLNVDQAPEVIICNFDLKPGYAGVENPLYTREKGVYLELGDAKETLTRLISEIK